MRRCGLVMIGQTAEIAPADKFLYALRDATATVESIPLIAASIMSKKLAEGIDGLVLDVKTGAGAFMERFGDARKLAETMCAIGRSMGKRVVALITRMDEPLGRAVGNAVEVAESVECLRGEGPFDLMEVTLELAAEMIVMGERARTIDEARGICRRLIAEGRALERFRRMVEAQGGDPRVVDDPALLPASRRRIDVTAARHRNRRAAGRPTDRSCHHAAGCRTGSGGLEDRSGRGNRPAQEVRRSCAGRAKPCARCWSMTSRIWPRSPRWSRRPIRWPTTR